MTDAALAEQIEGIARRYPCRRSALMPALHLAQRRSGGHLSREDVNYVADTIGISRSAAFGVYTFYTMYNKQPVGKYHLQVDTNVPALLMGADEILDHLRTVLGIEVGHTTSDGLFTLSTVEDLGSCGTLPVVQVNDRYYENMSPEKVDVLLAGLRGGKMPDWESVAHFGSKCGILLARRGVNGPVSLKRYVADGGYSALDRALAMEPSQVTAEVKQAGLRGRGGAGFPTGVKWSFLPQGTDKPVYLICNADEGEPGTFKDRQILEHDPHLLLEGMAIAAYAIGARLGFIYIRGEFAWIANRLEKAIEEARSEGKLGSDILGKGVEFDIVVHRGAGAYICGEETALIASLEGKRGNPCIRPPFPTQEGLYGCPTIINNVETLACVPYILQNGADAFRAIGIPNNFGPKIFAVSGHVNRPGAYEFPLGTPLAAVLEAAGDVIGTLKAVIVGGISAPVLTATECSDLRLDFDSCIRHGTSLGSGGIIVMNDTVSIPEIALRAMQFYAHESCGKCIPCREGSSIVVRLMEKIVAGKGEPSDVDTAQQLCEDVYGTTLCPGGDAWALAVGTMIRKFRSEFEALVR